MQFLPIFLARSFLLQTKEVFPVMSLLAGGFFRKGERRRRRRRLKIGLCHDDVATAERQFRETPELVEKLLPYLDLTSTKHLAESHKLTRKILRKTFTWKKLIQKILPGDERVEFSCDQIDFDHRHPLIASERQKARILAEILTLMKGTVTQSKGDQKS